MSPIDQSSIHFLHYNSHGQDYNWEGYLERPTSDHRFEKASEVVEGARPTSVSPRAVA